MILSIYRKEVSAWITCWMGWMKQRSCIALLIHVCDFNFENPSYMEHRPVCIMTSSHHLSFFPKIKPENSFPLSFFHGLQTCELEHLWCSHDKIRSDQTNMPSILDHTLNQGWWARTEYRSGGLQYLECISSNLQIQMMGTKPLKCRIEKETVRF